jgi:hypothetical protein
VKQSEIDWFRPLWRRIAVTGFIAGWAVMEWAVWHDELFRWITLAALAYAVCNFFIFYDRGTKTPGGDDATPEA